MKLSQFFISRPIFAGVLSALIFLAGLIALPRLPISEYPEVVPPTVVVKATYPGANPKVIAETVASPLEQSINGVEGMLYQSSQATADGVMTLTITFALGTDVDKAQVQVQNRVSQALPKLPDVVQRLGVITNKASPDLTMVVHLVSPDNRYDTLYLSNYALLRVKDELARLDGVGDVQVFGAGQFSMRVWLDPEKVASRGLTADDIVKSIREQNIQVAAGQLGAPPLPSATEFQVAINAKGRLTSEDDFRNIVVRTGAAGQVTRLKDVARVELGADTYALRALLDNQAAAAIPIFQRPGSNAIAISERVRAKMQELKRDFPQGVDYQIVYDPTVFVRGSIHAVVHTLFEAILLVVVVVIVFLQTWRASVIPLIAVPVSLVGTFAVMHVFGFSLNALSLFGLVLAIGIVVDDAIVVVENVERNIEMGLAPVAATRKAMREVTGPIVATALVLCAVFVPTAFISGLTGQFYKQFALTIAISTVISAFNSLTLSPALSALLLKEHGAPPDYLTRVLDRLLGGFFRPFNRFFARFSARYVSVVGRVVRAAGVALFVYGGLVALGYLGFARTPTGFVPPQDKQYLVSFAQLPDAATLDRTESVIRRMGEIALKQPGVEHAVAFPGLSINGFTNSPNSGIVFVTLKPFEERKSKDLSAGAIAAALNQQYGKIQEAFIAVFPPPPVMGLGTIGGFRMQIEDRSGLGFEELYKQTQNLIAKGNQDPALSGLFSSYQVNVPQVDAEVDREKAESQGVPIQELFDTMQVYLGSLYVNDFNAFGRTYPVNAQAEPGFRLQAEDIVRLKTRNAAGDMIPLGSFVTVKRSSGPDRVMHYNSYPTAEINGGPGLGYSSGQAQAAMERLARQELPNGLSFEWTELTYQQILAGNTALLVFPLVVLLVFLVLAAQYESLTLPLAIILIMPMVLLSAIIGVEITHGDNNIFTQIGLIVLVGLAGKNAILIVEFARDRELERASTPLEAALDAARLRLRPILMTSLAFIMGVVPLVASSGAGSEMRHAMGIAVFSGMLGVTFFGLLLTPLFYVLVRKLSRRTLVRTDDGQLADAPGAQAPLLARSTEVST
jgi:multidrug efflux pump